MLISYWSDGLFNVVNLKLVESFYMKEKNGLYVIYFAYNFKERRYDSYEFCDKHTAKRCMEAIMDAYERGDRRLDITYKSTFQFG